MNKNYIFIFMAGALIGGGVTWFLQRSPSPGGTSQSSKDIVTPVPRNEESQLNSDASEPASPSTEIIPQTESPRGNDSQMDQFARGITESDDEHSAVAPEEAPPESVPDDSENDDEENEN